MRLIFSLSVMILLFYATGCATILNDDTQQISFDSEPVGAFVSIDGIRKGVTPCVLPVARKGFDKQISMEKAGYKTELFKLDNTISGKTFINVLWWPGAIVDGISGRGGHYEDNIKIILERGSGTNDRTVKDEEDNSNKESNDDDDDDM